MIKIGFNGFQDFKQSTIEPEQRRNVSPIERFNRENNIDSGTEYIEGYFGKVAENINNTLLKINGQDLERAINLICDPQKRLYVIGSASARSLAEYCYLPGRYIKKDIVLLDANIANHA